MPMKRLLLITAVLGGAALVPLAAQAQRGMGGRGGVAVSHAGAGAIRAPRMGSVNGVRPAVRVSPAGSTTGARFQRFSVPRNRFAFNRFDRFRHRRFFNDCFNGFGRFGFDCGVNPFLAGDLGYGLWDPFYNQPQQQQQPVAMEDNDNGNRELAFEMQALRDEILAMHDEQQAREEARNAPAPKPAAASDEANAVLVFRDGRQLSVRNYAISNHTIWVLSPNNARKIQVAELDVPATEQINAKNGVEFHLPR